VIINIEGNIIAPYVMGRTFVVDPVEVVIAILFFGWIWGIIGAFLAIPLIISLKIILDNISEDNFMKTLSE
jgi:predicted PurR-regulated permease PerM